MTSHTMDDFFKKQQPTVTETETTVANKRTLSDSSANGGNSPKRIIYDAEDAPIDLPEDSPPWVAVLLQAIDRVNSKIEDLSLAFDSYKSDVSSQVSVLKSSIDDLKLDYDHQILDLSNSVKFIADKYDEQVVINKALQGRIDQLEVHQETTKHVCKAHEQELSTQSAAIEAQEQYSRRNCALLHGIPEADGEDTDARFIEIVNQQLGVALETRDLDRSHRLGAPRQNGARPIIVKFARYNTRAAVFRVKKKFKGTNFMLTESLTRRRVGVLNDARKRFGNKNVWTMDGEIFTKDNNKTVNVRALLYSNQTPGP